MLTCAGHGDDCPVEGLREGVEHCVRFILLQGISEASKDEHAHADRHGEEEELPGGELVKGHLLPVAVPQGRTKGLQASDVPGQLEDSQDAQNTENLRGFGDVLD